jgi:hypothetical protein
MVAGVRSSALQRTPNGQYRLYGRNPDGPKFLATRTEEHNCRRDSVTRIWGTVAFFLVVLRWLAHRTWHRTQKTAQALEWLLSPSFWQSQVRRR